MAMTITFVTLAVAVVLFVSDRFRLEVVALAALLTLLLTGVLTTGEALAGFSDPVVVLIGALFLVGEGLSRTGVARSAGTLLARVGGDSEARLTAACVVTSALLSALMSSTGAVAVLIPVVAGLSRNAGISPSKLLMPLSFGSLLGGMLTLIGTPPNMVVSAALEAEGLEPFHFFSFTPPGLIMLIAGVVYLTGFGRRLLAPRARVPGQNGAEMDEIDHRPAVELIDDYGLRRVTFAVRVGDDSPLVGQPLREEHLTDRYRLAVLDIRREDGITILEGPPTADSVIPARSYLLLRGNLPDVERACQELSLEQVDREATLPEEGAPELMAAEVLLTPRSRLIGQTLKGARFQDRYDVQVIGIRRLGRPIEGDLGDLRLRFGDALLVRGTPRRLRNLRARRSNLVVVTEAAGLRPLGGRPASEERHAPKAILITAAMLIFMATGLLPVVTAALLAGLAMVATRCIKLPRAYSAINWESLILIACMLPMATAMEKTGGLELIVSGVVSGLGPLGSTGLMAGLFLITSLLSLVMSNTATSVLIAPVAIRAALALGASPHAFLMTVALAASTAFATPMASPTNTLVLVPGEYRFRDYVRLGVPLQVLVFVLTVLVVPLLFG